MSTNYIFKINGKKLKADKQILTGEEILIIAEFDPPNEYELFLKVDKKEFEPVQLNEEVDVAMPGIEKFRVTSIKKIKFYVDDQTIETVDCFLTADEILSKVGLSGDDYYLKQIKGHQSISYKNDRDLDIRLHNNMKFSTCKLGPATVS